MQPTLSVLLLIGILASLWAAIGYFAIANVALGCGMLVFVGILITGFILGIR